MINRISNGDLEVASDIDNLTDGSIRFGRRYETRNGVCYVVEITGGVDGTQFDLMIVGMTARADCRGPYVLNGLTIVTGVLNEVKKDMAI